MPNSILPRAVLLDLDDTILDDTGDLARLWRDVTFEAAQELKDVDGETLLAAVDRVRTWYWSDPERHREGRQDLRAATRSIVSEALGALALDRPDLAVWIADQYRDRRDAALRVFPGAVELLERLRRDGVGTALLTNGSGTGQRAKLERFDLARYFDCVLIEGEFGVGKPDPRVYRAALEALGSEPHHTWMVGDNLDWDVGAPQRLGLRGIWIDRYGRGVPSDAGVRPDRIIRHLAELL